MKINRPYTNIIFLFLFILLALFGCSRDNGEKGSPEYINQIKQWHQKRIENLKKENGWLNLAGLFWLKNGENTFGTNPAAMLLADGCARNIFTIKLTPRTVTKTIRTRSNMVYLPTASKM